MGVPQRIRQKAYYYGAEDIVESWRQYKKYAVFYNNKWIHFGDTRYADYTTHKDPDRRRSYQQRASNITNVYGERTYKNKNYANFWAYHLLW
jgi:hypothetical protein